MLSSQPLRCELAGVALARASAVVYSLSPALVPGAMKAVKERKAPDFTLESTVLSHRSVNYYGGCHV